MKVLDGIEDGALHAVPQSTDDVSLAPKITVEDARIRWQDPAMAVDRRIRGCTPAPGAWTMLGEVKERQALIERALGASAHGRPASFTRHRLTGRRAAGD